MLTTAAFLWFAAGGRGRRASSRWAWAVGSTPPMRGTAAWRRSPTSGSTTWSTWAPRSTAIAREKAAIIKRGDRAVTGATADALTVDPSPRRPDAARRSVWSRRCRWWASGIDGLRVAHPGSGELRLGLLGRHQAANAAVALGVVEALGGRGHRRRSAPTRSGAGSRPRAGRVASSCCACRRRRRAARRRPQRGRRRGARRRGRGAGPGSAPCAPGHARSWRYPRATRRWPGMLEALPVRRPGCERHGC